MVDWKKLLQHDPVEPLLSSKYVATQYFSRRDLLGEDVESIENLWNLKEPKKLLGRQLEDGSWKYPGKNPARYPDVKYGLAETFKHLRLLVGKYGFDRSHPVIARAVEDMFSCQTDEGYMPVSIILTTVVPSWSISLKQDTVMILVLRSVSVGCYLYRGRMVAGHLQCSLKG